MCTRPARRPRAPKAVAGAALAAALIASPVLAGPVGQTWRAFPDPSAASRDYLGRAQVRAVVWYPAASGAAERPIVIGPPDAVTFTGGMAAPEAAWARGRHPLIVMSHGSGGTALQYGWLGAELARRGFIVVAVDHPGASGGERATDAGTRQWWMRGEDIRAAIDAVLADKALAPRVDRGRIAMVGYSLGGATALQLAGATPSAQGLISTAPPDMTYSDFMVQVNQMQFIADRRIKAFALIAPAVLPALDVTKVGRSAPMLVIAGDADVTVKPADNAMKLAQSPPGARVEVLPGVAHNDFLQLCTDAGRARYADLCREPNAQREATHAKTAELIGAFFAQALR